MAQVKGDTSPAQTCSASASSPCSSSSRSGQSVAQIAESLKLSPSTVGTHLYQREAEAQGASNQSELTLVALQWGLIQI
jgi:two-component system invasion response regulator UvrY